MRHVLMLIAAGLLLCFAREGLAQGGAAAAGGGPAAGAGDRPVLSRTAATLVEQVEFAVQDLTPEQKKKTVALAVKYDAEITPLESAHREDHQASLRRARETRTPIDLKAREIIQAVQQRKERRVEQKYADLVGAQVLTPAQRAAWEAYRLQFASTYDLSMAGATEEQLHAAGPLAAKVVKEVKPTAGPGGAAAGAALFEKRLDVLRARAAKEILNEEQRAKYLDRLAKQAEFLRAMDQAEKTGGATPPAAGAKPAESTEPPPPF